MIRQINLYILLLCCSCAAKAQIGINTDKPSSSAALHIEAAGLNKGVLVPRMTTAQKLAIPNPAPSLLVYDLNCNCISQYKDTPSTPGVYAWTSLVFEAPDFIYMPSVNIPTTNAAGNLLTGTQTLDLYAPYQSGFSAPKVKSLSAPASIPYLSRDQLNYYITYCDPSITVTGISDSGILSYKVNKRSNYDAYMNIVFTLK